MSNKPINRD